MALPAAFNMPKRNVRRQGFAPIAIEFDQKADRGAQRCCRAPTFERKTAQETAANLFEYLVFRCKFSSGVRPTRLCCALDQKCIGFDQIEAGDSGNRCFNIVTLANSLCHRTQNIRNADQAFSALISGCQEGFFKPLARPKMGSTDE